MTGLDRSTMEQFYRKPDYTTAAEVTRACGLRDLLSDVLLDDHQFDPLGYSLNGIQDSDYYTIHITPQPECSFVSFETNAEFASYRDMVQKVVSLFKPESFTVLLYNDTKSTLEEIGTAYEGFYLRNSKHHKFSPFHEYNLTFCSFRQYGTVSPMVMKRPPKPQYQRHISSGTTNTKPVPKQSTETMDPEKPAITVLS